jgi:predicted metalloendopeptidase
MIQYIFYEYCDPNEVNLRAIRVVIGYELGKAIDNHGNLFF